MLCNARDIVRIYIDCKQCGKHVSSVSGDRNERTKSESKKQVESCLDSPK